MKNLTRFLGVVVVMLLALMAGFFYAFSVTVMPGLDMTAPAVAVPAMQKINEAVRNPVFFFTFFVTPFAALLTTLTAWLAGLRSVAIWYGVAAVVYLGFAVVPTVTVNVPMNEALALSSSATPQRWAMYSMEWTQWNTGRTITTLVALLAALVAFAATPWSKAGV